MVTCLLCNIQESTHEPTIHQFLYGRKPDLGMGHICMFTVFFLDNSWIRIQSDIMKMKKARIFGVREHAIRMKKAKLTKLHFYRFYRTARRLGKTEATYYPGHLSDLHKLHGWQLRCQYWLNGNQHQSASQLLDGSKRIISIDKSKRHVAKKKPLPQGTAQVIKGPPPREGMLKRTEWQGQCEERDHHI